MNVNEFIRYRRRIFFIIEILSIALVLGNVGYSIAVYDDLPEKVPSRFDGKGVPVGWMSKSVDLGAWAAIVLFTFAALSIANYLFFFKSVQTNYLATTGVLIFTFLLLIRIEVVRFSLETLEKSIFSVRQTSESLSFRFSCRMFISRRLRVLKDSIGWGSRN